MGCGVERTCEVLIGNYELEINRGIYCFSYVAEHHTQAGMAAFKGLQYWQSSGHGPGHKRRSHTSYDLFCLTVCGTVFCSRYSYHNVDERDY
jgi:hypothetical protein